MAKDQTALLTEISTQLKKMNQSTVREKMQQQNMVERQEAILAGAPTAADSGGEALTDAEDFKRRFVAARAGKMFDNKMKPESSKQALSRETLNTDHFASININLLALNTSMWAIRWAQLDQLKPIEDGIGEVVNVLHAQLDFWKDMLADNKKDRMDDKRSLLESSREGNKQTLIGQSAPILGLPSPSSTKKGMGFGAMAMRALPYAIAAGAVALAVGAISDFVSGWKEDGLAGSIGKGLGGAGEGIWNSIKQSFKVGGLGATIGGTIGLAFGGIGAIPGAIIGGLIGMAVGAVAGYFGGEKITEGLNQAGKAVSKAWDATKGVFNSIVGTIANWIFTPGSKENHHNDAVKTTMFGGFISWEADNFTIGAAWTSAMNSIGSMITKIGDWVYSDGKLFGAAFTLPDFDLSDLTDGLSSMWDTIRDIPGKIKKALMGMFPLWMQEGLGWTDSTPPGNITTMNSPKQPSFAQTLKGHGADIPMGLVDPSILHSMRIMSLADRHGSDNPIGTLSGEEIAKALLQQAVEAELKIFDKTSKLMQRNGKSKLGDVIVTPLPDTIITSQKLDMSLKNPRLTPQQSAPVTVTDASTGKGATTNYNSTYIDRNWQSPGTGSNANGVVTESGVIWSW